jgi:hypothetical protein
MSRRALTGGVLFCVRQIADHGVWAWQKGMARHAPTLSFHLPCGVGAWRAMPFSL